MGSNIIKLLLPPKGLKAMTEPRMTVARYYGELFLMLLATSMLPILKLILWIWDLSFGKTQYKEK